MKATLAINYELMANKLMEAGNKGTKEAKKKLFESLPDREKQQLKVIKDMSMRTLLKDLLYFHSNLSERQHEWILKQLRKDKRARKYLQRNIINVHEMSEYFDNLRKQKEIELEKEQKKKEAEEIRQKLMLATGKKKEEEPPLSEIDLRQINLPILLHMKMNSSAPIDAPVQPLNEISETLYIDTQDECSQDFEVGMHKRKVVEQDAQKPEESKMRSLNPLNNAETLSQRAIYDIKKKSDTSKVYATEVQND